MVKPLADFEESLGSVPSTDTVAALSSFMSTSLKPGGKEETSVEKMLPQARTVGKLVGHSLN